MHDFEEFKQKKREQNDRMNNNKKDNFANIKQLK